MSPTIYTHDELFDYSTPPAYPNKASAAAFLLGGIGTGNVSLGARGELRDWEIFNKPGKGRILPYTFFTVRIQEEGKEPLARVLEAAVDYPAHGMTGYSHPEVVGLPRFEKSLMTSQYPFVSIDLIDKRLPIRARLEAFTPFIPLNSDDSGIPAAVLRYHIANRGTGPLEVTVAGSLANPVGMAGLNLNQQLELDKTPRNEFRQEGGLSGLYFTSPELKRDHLTNGSMALMTKAADVTAKPVWMVGGYTQGVRDFWDDLLADGRLESEARSVSQASNMSLTTRTRIGSLGICATLQPGEEKVFDFILAWHFPNRPNGWYSFADQRKAISMEMFFDILRQIPNSQKIKFFAMELTRKKTTHTYYNNLWKNAWEVGGYLLDEMPRLEKGSRDFTRALYGSTLPNYVIEALANNITVIRSTTCLRLENGRFAGFEGTFDNLGCCQGSCTHVWNYAETLAFLFPDLERSMRETEFNLETEENGMMHFRTEKVFRDDAINFLSWPASDGQLGCIIRLYRDWKLSGDDAFLRQVWENAKRALDYAFKTWDPDGDFVLEAPQHTTYDIEFYGMSSMTNAIFLAAVKAGAEMAAYLGDKAAKRYQDAYENGSQRVDDLLYNGEYYIQKLDDIESHHYQYGEGCLGDQLLGQLLAHVAGLGYILPEEHVGRAVRALFEHNFCPDLGEHTNYERGFVLAGEKGLLQLTWPRGGKPRFPIHTAEEVWTGTEYQAAAHLIYEGALEEGLTIVKAVRERFDGFKRSPWNEIECGNHYVRSLSSWAVLTALSGFEYDMVKGKMSFKPALRPEDFSTFWSTGKAWGTYSQKLDPVSGKRTWDVDVLYGDLAGVEINSERRVS